MLQFMHDHKGSLSLFTLFLLVPIMILSSVLMDLARAKAVEAHASAVAETYANSYLSVYDEMLNELYGLFAVTQTNTAPLEQLEAYMKASFKPGSMEDTGLNNAFLSSLLSSHYDDALSLTGSALSDLSAAAGKPLVDNGNYNNLQMQMSEYVKFIGPTDLLGTTLSMLIAPGSNEEEKKNEVEQTNKNYKRIKEKKEIDDLIGDLNDRITVLYTKMKDYDDAIYGYFYRMNDVPPGVQGYAFGEILAYRQATDTVAEAFYELDDLAGDILADIETFEEQNKAVEDSNDDTDDTDNAGNAEGDTDSDTQDSNDSGSQDTAEQEPPVYVLSDDLKQRLDKIMHMSDGDFLTDLDDVITCFGDGAGDDEINKANAVAYDNNDIAGHVSSYYVDINGNSSYEYSAYNVYQKRIALVQEAKNFESNLAYIRQRLKNLITELENDPDKDEGTQKFLEGIKKDYEVIINLTADPPSDEPDKRKMWVIANFNYSGFADDFGTYAAQGEEQIKNDLQELFAPGYGILGNEDMFQIIGDGIYDFVYRLGSDDADYKSLAEEIQTWVNDNKNSVELAKEGKPDEHVYSVTTNNLSAYYRKFDDEFNDKRQGNITYREFYNILKDWNKVSAEQQAEKEKADGLTADIWQAIKDMKFNNIGLREGCRNKVMPVGKNGADNNEKKDLSNILSEEESGLPDTDTGTAFVNKLLTILYDYGMFTCQTSDKKQNENEEVEPYQPMSYQGVKLAVSKDGKFESSETNFLLYGELEYIFNGDRDPEKNMNAVRNSLAVIRFVPNYISTYTIDEINAIVNAVQSALSWCPPAAIIAAQALRIALAGFETWCDLDLLYGGSSVLLYKNKLGDLSFIGVLRQTELGKKIYNTLNGYADTLDGDKSTSPSNLKVNYCQYLILLEMIFVSGDEMVQRTADLINANMNFIIGGTVDAGDGKITVPQDKFSLSEACTSVNVTCSVKRDFIFSGSMVNSREAGYSEAADLADSMDNDSYSVSISRGY